MANLASPIPMMDPNTNNDSGYVTSNIDGEKEHTPPPSPSNRAQTNKEANSSVSKKPDLK